MKKPLIIALPGTGKTTTAHAVCDLLGDGRTVVSTDELFRVYRAIPLASNDDGHQIMKNFVARAERDYPNYADEIKSHAESGALSDSKLFRAIGANQYGEDIFRTFEIEMLKWLNAEGKFDKTLADLSASAPLYADNRAIFSEDNGYKVFLLEAPEDIVADHLLADYERHKTSGKIIRGGYEAAVQKAGGNARDALLAMHRKDRVARMDKYRAFAHVTFNVSDESPRDIALRIVEAL